jgi:hypothetical protein
MSAITVTGKLVEFDLTHQSIFDTIAKHLLSQARPAFFIDRDEEGNETHSCLYRGSNDTSCAFGCIIPDDKYDSEIEDESATSVIEIIVRLPI